MGRSVLRDKSYAFALRIIKLYDYLKNNKSDYVLGRQILRCGTSIGAMVSEGEFAQSKPDFISKLYIALKEANETLYWLSLLHNSGYITKKMFESISDDNKELIALLVKSIKTAKTK